MRVLQAFRYKNPAKMNNFQRARSVYICLRVCAIISNVRNEVIR